MGPKSLVKTGVIHAGFFINNEVRLRVPDPPSEGGKAGLVIGEPRLPTDGQTDGIQMRF